MIPLRDENPIHRTPYVNYTLIAINIAAFLFELSLGHAGLTRLFYAYGVVPARLTGALGALQHHRAVGASALWPIVTSMFLHAGWLHLLGNMAFLWIFGDNLEDRLGHVGYGAFYLLAGVVAILVQTAASPLGGLPAVGASGAIGGVLGAYIVLYPAARVSSLIFLGFFASTARVPAWVFLGLWFAMQSFQGLVALQAPSTTAHGGVAFWAHIGGFAFGALVGLAARARPAPRPPRSPFADRWYSNR